MAAKMRLGMAVLIGWLMTSSAWAGRVDTVWVPSRSMHRSLACVVITPDRVRSAPAVRFPVVYLLHGYSGRYSNWIQDVPELATLADQHGVLLVCPDGGNSWYIDSPVDSTLRYETFVAGELPAYIDAHYPTDRRQRAITGFSMGGHGALYLAMRHPDVFAQAASLSGGVDIRPFPNNWDLTKILGEAATHADNWNRHTVLNVSDRLRNGDLRLLIDCGLDDFFLDVNRQLHRKLLRRGIDHDYVERPGAHNWDYWRGNIAYHLLFFRKGFGDVAGQNGTK